jgi:hypothetical protein
VHDRGLHLLTHHLDAVAFVHIRTTFADRAELLDQLGVWCAAARRRLLRLHSEPVEDLQHEQDSPEEASSQEQGVLCSFDNLAIEQPGQGQQLRCYVRLYLQGTHNGGENEATQAHQLFNDVWSTTLQDVSVGVVGC